MMNNPGPLICHTVWIDIVKDIQIQTTNILFKYCCLPVLHLYYDVADFKYAIRSALSPFFLIPAKIIFVPGMYFLGFSKYSIKVSSPQTMPEKRHKKDWLNITIPSHRETKDKLYFINQPYPCSYWHLCRNTPLPGQSCDQKDPKDLAPLCACHHFQQCGTGHTSGRKPSYPYQRHPYLPRRKGDVKTLQKGIWRVNSFKTQRTDHQKVIRGWSIYMLNQTPSRHKSTNISSKTAYKVSSPPKEM